MKKKSLVSPIYYFFMCSLIIFSIFENVKKLFQGLHENKNHEKECFFHLV